MNIGIVGYGVVGRALHAYYEKTVGIEHLFTYDKAIGGPAALALLNDKADVVFICVGTPYSGNGKGLDCSQVHAAVDALTGNKTVVIKSTVNHGVTDDIQAKHPEHRVFFVPEFLSEATAAEDYARPRRSHVIGVPDTWPAIFEKDRDARREYMLNALEDCPAPPVFIDSVAYKQGYYVPPFSFLLPEYYELILGSEEWNEPGPVYLPARQAELLKLATNAFYALKVAYANMLYDCGMTQETLDALGADPWIGGEHFEVEHKGFRGFGGKCLPKDLRALADYAASVPAPDGKENWLQGMCNFPMSYNNKMLRDQNIDVNDFLGACKV